MHYARTGDAKHTHSSWELGRVGHVPGESRATIVAGKADGIFPGAKRTLSARWRTVCALGTLRTAKGPKLFVCPHSVALL